MKAPRGEPPVWRRHGLSIVPMNDAATAMLRGFAPGELFTGRFARKRSLKQLRLWWSLMTVLTEASIFPTKDAASDAVKISIGFVDTIIMPGSGQAFFTPRSIAFESLAQSEFNPVFQAALDAICDRWIKTKPETLRMQVYAMIDGPSRIGDRTE